MKWRKNEPKSLHILHTTKDKHQPALTAESNKHEDSRNGVKAKKKQIQMEWSMHKRLGHHLLVPSQYMGGEPQVKTFRWWWGEKGVYTGVLAQASLGRDVLLGWHLTQKR